jgi:uncharacterized sulfatase
VKVGLISWVLVVLSAVTFGRAADRPNIVLFIADDYTLEDCGPYGSKCARTPNLTRLAAEGMKFELAFAASAMYTGLYPFRNGAHANHSFARDDVRTLPQYMKELGYRTVLAGKSHIGPRAAFPFEYLANSNIMPPGKNQLLWTDLNTQAVEQLLATRDAKQPLCLLVAAHSPHVFWPENDGYDPKRLTLAPYMLDTPETRRARCRYLTDVTWMDKQVGEVRESIEKHGMTDNTLFVFIADQGAQWPFGKWNLYDLGIHAPMLVSWPGKVKAGSATLAMVSFVDLLPTFLEAAGTTPPKDLDGRSFLPVLLGQSDHHRGEIFASHTGDRDMNHSPMRCVRTEQYKYILNLSPDTVYKTHIDAGGGKDGKDYWSSWETLAKTDPHAAAVIDRYRHRLAEELYDVKSDPYELKNLAGDGNYSKVLAELREKVKAWRVSQGEDLGKVPMPEDARYGEMKYAG